MCDQGNKIKKVYLAGNFTAITTVCMYISAGADPGFFVRRSRFSDVIFGGGGEKKYLKLC